MPYITNLTVVYSSDASVNLPFPWYKIPVDLNKGSGGLFIYLFKKYGNGTPIPGASVTAVTVLQGASPAIPAGYQWDDTDLNKSVGGDFLYLAWSYTAGPSAILDVDVVWGDSRAEALNKKPAGWDFVDVDLNKGAGGTFIYLVYRRF